LVCVLFVSVFFVLAYPPPPETVGIEPCFLRFENIQVAKGAEPQRKCVLLCGLCGLGDFALSELA
jgi:hypothetical protein